MYYEAIRLTEEERCDEDDADEDAADLVAALDELEDELESGGDVIIGKDGNNWEYDMHREMSAEEVEGLEKSVKPVRSVLMKVH